MSQLKQVFGNRKVQLLALVIVVALGFIFLRDLNPATLDSNFGIEFIGGVRIPITLEKSVDSTTMSTMVEVIKNRINKYGLKQSIVQPLGDREIVVEIPRADEEVIKSVERILREQGKFEALIDGRQALGGEDVVAVGGAGSEQTPKTTKSDRWELNFVVSREGGERFAEVARGKAEYPVMLFLDRPENAVLLEYRSYLSESALNAAASNAVSEALRKEGDDILLFYVEDFAKDKEAIASSNRSKIIVSSELKEKNPEVYSELLAMGFKPLEEVTASEKEAENAKVLVTRSPAEMTPSLNSGANANVNRWEAIGLLSAPLLSEGLANGYVSQYYSITGTAVGETEKQKEAYAQEEIKRLKSVISGGRLPVSTVVGSAYAVAPSLGEQFLYYSAVALFLAIIGVSATIMVRYKIVKLIIPIIVTNVCEIIILTAIMGTIGTIDLGAMAGIITLIGKGVDDQIIITDELLKKREKGDEEIVSQKQEAKKRVARAFYIILTTAGVAVVSMLPLMLSGIIEVVGFALSTVIGLLIGVLLTRPAYAVFVEVLFSKKEEGVHGQ
ncbi:MAG: hypothetical protein ACP5O3_04175 [Candidatus Micrarchaeia archaeon]